MRKEMGGGGGEGEEKKGKGMARRRVGSTVAFDDF